MGKNWKISSKICNLVKYKAWILSQRNKARERNKSNTTRKEISSSICRLYDPEDSTRKFLDLTNNCSKIVQYNINMQKSLALLYKIIKRYIENYIKLSKIVFEII
jgi:hypothetical protein